MIHMQGRYRHILWLAVLLVAGCGMIKVPEIPKSPMGAAQRALNRITGGTLDHEGASLIRAIGPSALRALDLIASTVVKSQGELGARVVVLEEQVRLLISASQSFYTDECSSVPAAPTVTSTDPASVGDSIRSEIEANEAFKNADYEKAESLLKAVYESREKQLGANHPIVLRLLNKRAAIQLAVNNYKQAIADALAALTSREQVLRGMRATSPPGHDEIAAALAVAESASTLANVYRAASAYPDAKKSYERAIELRTRYLGSDHLCTAQSQSGLGGLLQLMGDYPAAGKMFNAAYLIRRAKLGLKHRDTARSMSDLASLHRSIGDLDQAQELYRQALEIRRAFGEDDVDVAESHNDLGDLCKIRGDYVTAESEYRQALDVRRKKLGEGVETAQSQNALASLYQLMGDYRRAQELYSAVYNIRQKVLGPDHPDTAESLNDLGDMHLVLGDYTKAETEYGQALDIRRKKLGSTHGLVAKSLLALGNVHVALGKYNEAENEYNRASEIQQKQFGAEHPDVAQFQQQQGLLHQARGDYSKAESLFRSALLLREKKLGAGHPSVAESLVALAKLMMVTGRPPQALEYLRRAVGISEQLLQRVGVVTSESRLDALLRLLRTQEEIAYSLLLERSRPGDAATFAMSVALLRKGRSLDEAAAASRAVYESLDAAAREKLMELQATRTKINALAVAGGADPDEVRRVDHQADELERELAKDSAPLRARRMAARPGEIIARVAQALPSDGVLVEIVAFHPCMQRGAGPAPQQYLALVLHHDASVRVVPLGLGNQIDKLIGDFRRQLEKTDNIEQVVTSAGALYHSVFQPLRAQFDKADRNIFLALDSQLHLVPFGALFDGNQYLVESYQFTYLTSGRDLLRGNVGLADHTTITMIANPEFMKGEGSISRSKPHDRGMSITQSGPEPGPHDTVPDWPFEIKPIRPLPGTIEEAQDIRDLLHRVQVLSGRSATKKNFLSLQPPGILHVATHGVFLGDAYHTAAGPRPEFDSERAALLGSVLMLAGAGMRNSNGHVHLLPDGVVTALEVAGMNLWGTQLVVLSACDSGVGDVSNLGQGVYGLRRAVMAAGAETLVTSLWRVDDKTTRELMVRYYEHLLHGQGRVEAMRETADAMRRQHPHPHYWAAFIVVGSRDPLVGIKGIRVRS